MTLPEIVIAATTMQPQPTQDMEEIAHYAFTLSDLLQIGEIVSIVGGGLIALITFGRFTGRLETTIAASSARTDALQQEIGELKEETKKIAELVTGLAVTTTRLDAFSQRVLLLEKWYDELRRGEGYVFPLEYRRAPKGS